MSKKAIDFVFTGATTPIASYDSTKTNIGTLIKQYTGALATDKFAGPEIVSVARPGEASTSIFGGFPYIVQFSTTIDWVFLAENSAAAVTRRIIWYEFNKTTQVFTWKGFITLTYPAATAHTIRGLSVTKDNYTTGTVAVSGTTVTGTGSLWLTEPQSLGSRIGFGTTDPTAVTTWFEISAIGSDTSITLTSTAGSIPAGTAYVIEDLRVYTATTNATLTNGGLFVTKGLRIENFSTGGTTISAAVTTDNIRAVYWLADASTVTNTVAGGLYVDTRSSWTNQVAYIVNVTAATTPAIYVYNTRAALTLAAGKDTTTNTIKTGVQTVTGNVSQVGNGILATLSHGPGSGVKCLYFATTSRIIRVDLANITAASTTFVSDSMVEVPPGSSTTYPLTAVMSHVLYSSMIDRLVILTTSAAGQRGYVTQYNTTSAQFDHIFLIDDKNQDQSTAAVGSIPYPSLSNTQMVGGMLNGRMFIVRNSAAATLNQMYNLPIGAHWAYTSTSNQVLITPSIPTTNALKFYRLYVNEIKRLGTDPYVIQPEPYKMYARTSGISTNLGTWTLINDDGDLSGLTPTSEIQIKLEFNILGRYCIPSRIMSLAVVFEDTTTDSHYEPSIANSNVSTNVFAFRQSTAFGSNIPNLRIQLFNAVTGVPIIDDNVTSSAFGTFQYSSNNGLSWNAWSNTQDVVGNYIRYTATSLPGSTRIRALLTQA